MSVIWKDLMRRLVYYWDVRCGVGLRERCGWVFPLVVWWCICGGAILARFQSFVVVVGVRLGVGYFML